MNLRKGDWINIQYGFDRMDFLVSEVYKNGVKMNNPNWLVSDTITMTNDVLEWHKPIYVGKGKYRWWQKYIPFFDEFIMPYSKPLNVEENQ